MKKFFAAMVMLAVLIPAAAGAGKCSVSSTYWRVTDIFETHTAEGVLIGRELKFSRNINPKDDIYVEFFPDDPEWPEVKKIEVQDWLWLNTGPGKKVEVLFGHHPPAQMELGNILK